MSEVDPFDPFANPRALADSLLVTPSRSEILIVPDEVILAGKPVAVSLVAEGYAVAGAIRLRDSRARDEDYARERMAFIRKRPRALPPEPFIPNQAPTEVDRTRGAQLAHVISSSSIFERQAFTGAYLVRSTYESGTADSNMVKEALQSIPAPGRHKAHAELCLAGMHALVARAKLSYQGKIYSEGFQAIEARLVMQGSNNRALTEGLRAARPEDEGDLDAHFEAVLSASRQIVGSMTGHAALMRRQGTVTARARRRLRRAVS